MPDEPQKKETPLPVQMAREALKALALEDPAIAESLKKRLPAFAMQLARAGKEVTVELLLKHARTGELEKEAVPKPKTKTYAEIMTQFPEAEQEAVETIDEAVHIGDLETVKRLINEGTEVLAHYEKAMSSAAYFGHKDIVKYLIEEQGANAHCNDEQPLRFATMRGHLDIVKYLIEEQGVNPFDGRNKLCCSVSWHLDIIKYFSEKIGIDVHAGSEFILREAISYGDLDIIKYLIEEHGADVHVVDETPLRASAAYERPHIVQYLLEQGADARVLSQGQKKDREDYLAVCKTWQKIAHTEPPGILYKQDPAYFKSRVFEAVHEMLRQEDNTDMTMPFHAAALFGTEDRVLQYLEKWGKAGKQPLHDIIHMIKLPAKKMPEMDLKAWGDAVLKCGPSMARLVKFSDRLPIPEKSDDGRTWSMTKTREKVAQFAYKQAAENPVLAALCMEHDVDESAFNKALALSQKAPSFKNIPDIAIDGEQFDMPGATFRRLAANDIRGLFLGEMTNCCQSIGGVGAACAEHGFTSKNSGFYVVENARGKIVGQTWAWRGEKGELVFDSIETLGENVKPDQWLKLTESFSKALAKKPGNVTALQIGIGGATPKNLIKAFNNAASPAKPLNYKGYRDSEQQIVVWRAPAL